MGKFGIVLALVFWFLNFCFYLFGFFYTIYKCTFWDSMAFLIIFGAMYIFLGYWAELASGILTRPFCYMVAIFISMFLNSGIIWIVDDLAQRRAQDLVPDFDPSHQESKQVWQEMLRKSSKPKWEIVQER